MVSPCNVLYQNNSWVAVTPRMQQGMAQGQGFSYT